MIYGSDLPVQLANKDRTLNERDVIDYIYPHKPNRDEMLRCFYNNVTVASTSVWRLVSRGAVPWLPADKPKPLFQDLNVKVPRRLIAMRMSDLLPCYSPSFPKAQVWWQHNLEKIDNRFNIDYLNKQLGSISRSCCVRLFIEHDAYLDKAGVAFLLKFNKLLGYPDDKNFTTSFSIAVFLSNVEGTTLRDKATTLMSAPKHLRQRFAIMNDESHSLKECVKLADAIGCRVTLHSNNYVKYDGGPINLKHKLVEKAKRTCAIPGNSAMGFHVVVTDRKVGRLEKLIPAYSKIGDVVIKIRG